MTRTRRRPGDNGRRQRGRCAPRRWARPSRRRALRALLLAVLVACVGAASPGGAGADTPPPSEYQVKAALLLNFAKFIQWPEAAFDGPDDPMVVGVLGDDPFGTLLDQTFDGEQINGRTLEIRRSDQVQEMTDAHLLFVARSERYEVGRIVSALRDHSVATVGEIDDFALRGGLMNFYLEDSKVRFEINPGVAEQKALRISSQLLRRARIIGDVPRRDGN